MSAPDHCPFPSMDTELCRAECAAAQICKFTAEVDAFVAPALEQPLSVEPVIDLNHVSYLVPAAAGADARHLIGGF